MDSLNDLISMVSSLLDGGFDLHLYLEWKKMAFLTLLGLLGPFHYYTLNFRRMAKASPTGLLAGKGLLVAAREQMRSEAPHSD